MRIIIDGLSFLGRVWFMVECWLSSIGRNKVSPEISDAVKSTLPNYKIRTMPPNIFIGDIEYEWWVSANTPWEEEEYYNAPYGTQYDVYRKVKI